VKKKERRKIYEKSVKIACNTTKGGQTNGFDSWRVDTQFYS